MAAEPSNVTAIAAARRVDRYATDLAAEARAWIRGRLGKDDSDLCLLLSRLADVAAGSPMPQLTTLITKAIRRRAIEEVMSMVEWEFGLDRARAPVLAKDVLVRLRLMRDAPEDADG